MVYGRLVVCLILVPLSGAFGILNFLFIYFISQFSTRFHVSKSGFQRGIYFGCYVPGWILLFTIGRSHPTRECYRIKFFFSVPPGYKYTVYLRHSMSKCTQQHEKNTLFVQHPVYSFLACMFAYTAPEFRFITASSCRVEIPFSIVPLLFLFCVLHSM